MYFRPAPYSRFDGANGHAISVFDATLGTDQTRPLAASVPSRLVDSIRARSWKPFSREYSWSFTSRTPQPGRECLLNLWVHSADASAFEAGKQRITDFEIRLPNGDSFLGDGGGAGGSAGALGEVRALATFDKLPRRVKTLDLHFTVDGQPRHLRFPNPGYRENLPEWKAVPLPQKWEKDGLSVTLNSIETVPNTRHRVAYGEIWQKWRVKPNWTVTFNGKPAEKWFDVGFSVEDAAGNRSSTFGFLGEPAWKLNCTIRQSYAFPFAAQDVEWYGTVDPKRPKTIAPGEGELLPLSENVKRRTGTQFVGVFGAGEYEVMDGKIIKQQPPVAGSKASVTGSVRDENTGAVKFSVSHPAIYTVVGPSDGSGFKEININDEGRPVYLGGQGFPVSRGFMIWRRETFASQSNIHFGIARFRITDSCSFLVAPPASPASSPSSPNAPK